MKMDFRKISLSGLLFITTASFAGGVGIVAQVGSGGPGAGVAIGLGESLDLAIVGSASYLENSFKDYTLQGSFKFPIGIGEKTNLVLAPGLTWQMAIDSTNATPDYQTYQIEAGIGSTYQVTLNLKLGLEAVSSYAIKTKDQPKGLSLLNDWRAYAIYYW
jgi:hypothetical protein